MRSFQVYFPRPNPDKNSKQFLCEMPCDPTEYDPDHLVIPRRVREPWASFYLDIDTIECERRARLSFPITESYTTPADTRILGKGILNILIICTG